MEKLIITIVVYNRFSNLKRWLDCWKICEKPEGTELVVIHNYDKEEDQIPYKNLCVENNIKYIPRKNIGMDIGAFQDICRERLEGFSNDWDYLMWVADDTLPMYKKFAFCFLEEIKKPNVGVACLEISREVKTHLRTSGFIISKDTSRKLTFPVETIISKSDCYNFEHRSSNAFYEQIYKLHKKVVQVSLNLMVSHLWDTGHPTRLRLNRWNDHYKEFPVVISDNIKKPEVFFHIARRGNWREIAREQFALLSSVGLNRVNVGLFCPDGSAKECYEIAAKNNIDINILINDSRIGYPWELPTLGEIQKWCKINPDGTILYMGTKGVLNPDNHWENYFRMIIAFITIGRWHENIHLLDNHDVIGANYISKLQYEGSTIQPHFSGSFYIARADWVNKLPDIWDYSNSRFGELLYKDKGSPWERMCTEFWIAATPNIRYKSLELEENYWFGGKGMLEILNRLIIKYPSVYYPEAVETVKMLKNRQR